MGLAHHRLVTATLPPPPTHTRVSYTINHRVVLYYMCHGHSIITAHTQLVHRVSHLFQTHLNIVISSLPLATVMDSD